MIVQKTSYATVTVRSEMAASQRAQACCRKNERSPGTRKYMSRFEMLAKRDITGTQIC